jgi:hypothetical protein
MSELTAEQEAVSAELKRFAADLNLSDAQKSQAKAAIENARVKVAEYKKSGKTPTKEEVAAWRTNFRSKLVAFLTPEQLTKWDAEVSKAKTFMGQDV